MISRSFFSTSALLIGLFLSGCSHFSEEPVGIGSGTDELKKSPCAACENEPFYLHGKWVK